MTCIHGLDELNCPTCRILKATLPLNKLEKKKNRFLKIEHPYYNKKSLVNDQLQKELNDRKLNPKPNLINPVPIPILPSRIPNFKNQIFTERIRELDLKKGNRLEIPKEILVEDPEWKFEELE